MVKKVTKTSPSPPPKHSRVRSFFAGLCGALAIFLVLLNILIWWLSSTLTSTDMFTVKVTKLARSSVVQDFITTKVSQSLIENKDIPLQDIANELLTEQERAGKSDEQLRQAVADLIKADLLKVMQSKEFENLWVGTIQTVHSKLVAQLGSEPADLNIDMAPTINGAIDLLDQTRFTKIGDEISVPADQAIITIEAVNFAKPRQVYRVVIAGRIALLALAIILSILTVLVSTHHVRTMRRALIFLGVFCGLIALSFSASFLLRNIGGSAENGKLAVALVNVIFGDLRNIFAGLAVASIAIAIISKVVSVTLKRE